eukprot:7184188-Alexandrium_andersonii.AAC.1
MAVPRTVASDGELTRLQEAEGPGRLCRPSRALEPGCGRRRCSRPRGRWRREGLGGAEVRASSAASCTACAMDFRRKRIVPAGGVGRQPRP